MSRVPYQSQLGRSALFWLIPLLITAAGCSSDHVESTSSEIIGGGPDWVDHDYHQAVLGLYLGTRHVGNGFLIGNRVVTNSHVAAAFKYCLPSRFDCDLRFARTGSITMKLNTVVATDPYLDFALITVDELPDDLRGLIPNFDQNVVVGTPVYILGNIGSSDFVRSDGIVTGHDYERSKKPSFFHTADTIPGMSGSPVFSDDDELIGLHWGAKGGANQAIPMFLLKDLLQGSLN